MELLKKVEYDRLTGSSPTLKIQSTFEIPPSAFDAVATSKNWTSESCGLGWTFNLRPNGYTAMIYNGSSAPRTSCQLYINFDAGFLIQPTHKVKSVQCLLERRGESIRTVALWQNDLPMNSSVNVGPLVYLHGSSSVTLPTSLKCIVVLGPRTETKVQSKLGTQRMATVTADFMKGERSVDTKVYAYTRRSGCGAIAPHSFFLHSDIIHQYGCEALSLLFGKAEGFHSENALLDLHRLPESQERLTALDYEDDSDFEGDEEADAQEFPSSAPNPAENGLYSIAVLDTENAQEAQSSADSASSSAYNTTLPHIILNVSHAEVPGVKLALQSKNALRFGRIKVLSNGAYRTWFAIIQYIYTGAIQFAPLRSTKRPRPTPEACSPKSVYRIADEYGMDTLKQLAFKEIVSNMITAENVVDEVFSPFAHMYPAVHAHEILVVLQKKRDPAVNRRIMELHYNHGEGAMGLHEKDTMNKLMNQLML